MPGSLGSPALRNSHVIGGFPSYCFYPIFAAQIPRPLRFAMRTIVVAGMTPEATARAR
jgi:hypothetical protein